MKTATPKSTTKKATPVKSKPLKARVLEKLQPVRGKINNIVSKVKRPSKKAKKTTKAERVLARQQKKNGIIGIGLLFTVVSIVYSTYMTNLFVDGPLMWVALAPQVIFAGVTLLIAFYKIYK